MAYQDDITQHGLIHSWPLKIAISIPMLRVSILRFEENKRKACFMVTSENKKKIYV